MMRVQVVYRRLTPDEARAWFDCPPCNATGRRGNWPCNICDGSGRFARGRSYTYGTNVGLTVGSLVEVPGTWVSPTPQTATVVALASDYTGDVVTIIREVPRA